MTDTDTAQADPYAPIIAAMPIADVIDWLVKQQWSEFAQSLTVFYADRGYLTPKQETAARSMMVKVARRVTEQEAGKSGGVRKTPPPEGVHRTADGHTFKLYRTGNGRLALQKLEEHWTPDGQRWRFKYFGAYKLRKIELDESTLLSFDEARKFGRLTSRCINCMLKLSDTRSVAAGYGATCAKNHGWPYPTQAQAIEMIEAENLPVPVR